MIGFVGVGVMGEPICRHVASKSGKEVRAYDLASAPLARLAAHGVKAAASVQEIAEHSEVVYLSLPGELESRFAARGIHYIDAPVARTRAAAEAGTLSVMVGCADALFARVKPWLEYFATEVTRCGPAGAGQALKLINNMVLFQSVAALAEALALIRRLDLDPAKALAVLSKGSADSFALRNHAMKAMLPNEFPERAFSVEYALKDLGYALELARTAGIELTGLKSAKTLLEKAAAAGHGGEYFPVIAKVV